MKPILPLLLYVWLLYHLVGAVNCVVWLIATRSAPLPRRMLWWLPDMIRMNFILFAAAAREHDRDRREKQMDGLEKAAKERRN